MVLEFKKLSPISVIPKLNRKDLSFQLIPIEPTTIVCEQILPTGLAVNVPVGNLLLSKGIGCIVDIIYIDIPNEDKFKEIQLHIANGSDSPLYIRAGEPITNTWLVSMINPDIRNIQ